MQGARKGRKVANHSVFPMICGSGGSKSRLAKAAGAEPSGRMRHEKLRAIMVAKQMSRVKMPGTHLRLGGALFGSSNVEKVHAAVARSAFREPKRAKTPNSIGPLLQVEMAQESETPPWREAHFQVKSVKN